MTLTYSIILSLSLLVFWGCQVPEEPTINKVVVIIGDDHNRDVLGCYGNTIVNTPNLDRLASSGVRFTNAFANAPMCSASRQSILTGKYPHAAGVTLLRTSFPENQYTIAEHLQSQGYATMLIGKSHFNNGGTHGFDRIVSRRDWRAHTDTTATLLPDSIATRPQWKPFNDHARVWLNAETLPGSFYEKDAPATWFAKQAISFLEQNKDSSFLLWLAFHEPHSPFNFPIEYKDRHQPNEFSVPPTYKEDLRWMPEIFGDLTTEEKQGVINSYYTSVEHLDTSVGQILNKIEQLDIDDNTLVIYLGDHGYLLGHHGRFEKHMMWEEAVRSPLLIRAGKKFQKNITSEVLTEFVDLAPTILEIVGVGSMPELHGKSLVPVLDGATEHKDYVFSEFLADNKVMIRSKSMKYIYSTGKRDLAQGYATGKGPPGVAHRLYDLTKDPNETADRANYPEYSDTLKRMQQTLISWFEATHPMAHKSDPEWSKEEALDFFTIPPDKGANLDAK